MRDMEYQPQIEEDKLQAIADMAVRNINDMLTNTHIRLTADIPEGTQMAEVRITPDLPPSIRYFCALQAAATEGRRFLEDLQAYEEHEEYARTLIDNSLKYLKAAIFDDVEQISGTKDDFAGTKDDFAGTMDRYVETAKGIDGSVRVNMAGIMSAAKGIDENKRVNLLKIIIAASGTYGALGRLWKTEDEEARDKTMNDIKFFAESALKYALRLADVLRSEADPDDEDQEEDEDENE